MLPWEPVELPDARGVVNRTSGLLACLGRQAPHALLDGVKTLLKDDKKIRAGIVRLESGVSVFCKEYRDKGLKGKVRLLCKQSRARRAFDYACKMVDAHVSVAKPLGFVDITSGDLKGASYLFLEALDGVQDLRAFIGLPNLDDWLTKGEIIEKAACLLGKLHNHGMAHGDYKWGNLLYQTDTGSLYLTDYDGCKRVTGKGVSRNEAKDIARFLLNAKEAGVEERYLQLFIQRYASGRGLSSESFVEQTDSIFRKLEARHIKKYGHSRYLNEKS